MPVCIHCATPVPSLYLRYGKDHIVPSPCRSAICAPPSGDQGAAVVLADEYLEHGITIVILDLILAKPRAYRHLLFNRGYQQGAFPQTGSKTLQARGEGADLARKFLALGLVDAYIRWFYLCVEPAVSDHGYAQVTITPQGRLSKIVAGLPLHAGLFFPSYIPPSLTTTTSGAEAAPLCSTKWIWFPTTFLAVSSEQPDQILPTLVSYLNIVFITLVESAALHLAVCTATWIFAAPRSTTVKGKETERNNERTKGAPLSFWQPSKALILSQLSPLILLSFVLLWSSKFPHPTSNAVRTAPSSLQSRSVIWIIRTLLSSLYAGIAIATLIPTHTASAGNRPPRPKVWLTPIILGIGWLAQALTSWHLYHLSSKVKD